MNNILKGSVLVGVIIAGFAIGSYASAVHYPSTCHLKAKNPGDVVVVYNNKGLISDRRNSSWSDTFWHSANIPAGRYKISLEGFDGYGGRSYTTGQTNERYYVKFYNGDSSLVATSGSTGDLQDGVEQAYWKGVVNNNVTFNKSVSGIVLHHVIPYYNSNPNSVTPVCMLLENLNYTPPKPKVNGQCGSSNGKTFNTKPTSGLCSVGGASGVNGSGPWNWTCAGSNGGSTASCSAQITKAPTVNGQCGSSNGKTFDTKPTSGLCSVGGTSSVGGSGPWNWTCAGSNGGSTASCSAQITKAPNCGSSNKKTFNTKPTSGLCSVGSASSVGGNGPWDWTCTNGARTVSCNANITDAPKCGSSNGGTFSGAPTSGLCSVGKSSSVKGSGPWDWTCTSGVRIADCDAKYAKTAIQIIKSSKKGGDSQTIDSGADATFTITVKNTGEENLQHVYVSDAEASDCSKSEAEARELYDGNLFDPGESFTYVCTDKNVTQSYTNIAETRGDATTSSVSVSDKDDSKVVIKTVDPEPDPDPKPKPTPDPEPEEEDDDGAIGNFVWHDRNKNCIQDKGEEGIADVKLKLYNGNDVEKDETNSRGRYKFKGLDSGTYKVVVAQETIPDGCYQVCDPDGNKMDGKTKVKIEGDEYYRKADFGYYCPSAAPVAQTSPQTGAGAVAGTISFIAAALSAGVIHRRNTKQNA